jgi:hypothetical protein
VALDEVVGTFRETLGAGRLAVGSEEPPEPAFSVAFSLPACCVDWWEEIDPSGPSHPTGNAGRLVPLFSAMALFCSLSRAGDKFAEARALTKATSSNFSIILRALLPLAVDSLLLKSD